MKIQQKKQLWLKLFLYILFIFALKNNIKKYIFILINFLINYYNFSIIKFKNYLNYLKN